MTVPWPQLALLVVLTVDVGLVARSGRARAALLRLLDAGCLVTLLALGGFWRVFGWAP